MAKYIDLDNIPYICQDMTVKQLIEKTEIHENVIKRSKIDKAIEEITNLRQQYPNEDYYDCKWEILEILKKNIGE